MVLTIMLFVGHMAAFLFRPNRELLSGMTDGTVDAAYAAHRHALWKPDDAMYRATTHRTQQSKDACEPTVCRRLYLYSRTDRDTQSTTDTTVPSWQTVRILVMKCG